MRKLAELLSSITGQQVVDETGLEGTFDFNLEWTPDEMQKAATPGETAAAAGPSGPSIFSALPEQLGLRLEARKGPVAILVVDHVEKAATQN
jgi:uncharacterized protein (TIGR03435 family)